MITSEISLLNILLYCLIEEKDKDFKQEELKAIIDSIEGEYQKLILKDKTSEISIEPKTKNTTIKESKNYEKETKKFKKREEIS